MISIKTIWQKPNNSSEDFDYEQDGVHIAGRMLRMEEGIMLLIEEFDSSFEAECVRCGQTKEFKLREDKSEWMFYEHEPADMDDPNEIMRVNPERLYLDPTDMIRQELIIRTPEFPQCEEDCADFTPTHTTADKKKPFENLKDMWEESEK